MDSTYNISYIKNIETIYTVPGEGMSIDYTWSYAPRWARY